jgi:hypothetical protein
VTEAVAGFKADGMEYDEEALRQDVSAKQENFAVMKWLVENTKV